MLFVCEGWPLCLCDQIVIHLCPINPVLLQPGDFYLQVAPFCDQSARIVVCSLLEDEDLRAEVVEETPIPETSYPCIFSFDWLDEINDGRQGTPLSQCLLATEQGVVRLPWERVAVPEFVDVPQSAGSRMASAPPSYPLSQPPLPLLSPPPNSSSDESLPLSPSKESALKPVPLTIQNSHPSAFSVETRICPAKHGIAVSLCLVDASAASSSRLVRAKETKSEPQPIGWVSPKTWDSRFTGTNTNTSTKTSTGSDTCTPASGDLISCKGEDKDITVSENSDQDKGKDKNRQDTSRSEPTALAGAEGEYIDILQATMLFGKAQFLKEEKQKSEVQIQPYAPVQGQMQRYPQRPTQIQPRAQMEPHRQRQRQMATHIPPPTQPQAHAQLPTKPQTQSHSRPNMSAEKGPPSTFNHSQPHHPHSDFTDPSECVRTVRFSEKPCTPCMRRKQGGKVSRAQELRCRYRDSYQAALQNPVAFGKRERGDTLAVVEENGDFSPWSNRQVLLETETRDPCANVLSESGMQNHPPSSVTESICKDSGEYNTDPYRKPGDTNITSCMDYRGIDALQFGEIQEQTNDRTTVSFKEPQDVKSSKPYDGTHDVNGTSSAAETQTANTKTLSSSNGTRQSHVSTKHSGRPFSSNEISGMHMTLKSCEQLQNRTNSAGMSSTASQNRQACTSDRRCSSLSTAVVDTSERCELVIVDGKNVRRRENTDSCAEIPQLHVVKCKNSTAFRLVSPKINRRKMVVPGTELSHSCHIFIFTLGLCRCCCC